MNRRATNYSEPHVQVKSEKFQPDECNSDSGETRKWVVCEGSLLKEVLKVDHTDWSIETSRDLSENIDQKVQHNCESVSEDSVTHTNVEPYISLVCTKKFTQHTSNAHEQHICATCGKSFTSSSQCSTHEQIHTDFKPNTCHICGQSFAMTSNLNTHEKIHIGVKLYACYICRKSFTTPND